MKKSGISNPNLDFSQYSPHVYAHDFSGAQTVTNQYAARNAPISAAEFHGEAASFDSSRSKGLQTFGQDFHPSSTSLRESTAMISHSMPAISGSGVYRHSNWWDGSRGAAQPSLSTTSGELTRTSSRASHMTRQSSIAGTSSRGDFELPQPETLSHVSNLDSDRGEFHPCRCTSLIDPAKGMKIGLVDDASPYFPTPSNRVEYESSSPLPFSSCPLNVPVSYPTTVASHFPVSVSSSFPPQSHFPSSAQLDLALEGMLPYDLHPSLDARRLAPKPTQEPGVISRPRLPMSPFMTSVQYNDGTQRKRVAIPPRSPYTRPTYPKKYCPHCSEHPEGFRGEHELRRHVDRAHTTSRKVWVCVNASQDSDFLANCKACRNNKKYGAYYNAAAHLRRAHFNPRKHRGRGRGRSDEKRGGKGGGDHPPMDELKPYLKEVDEIVNEKCNTAPVEDWFESPTSEPTPFLSSNDFEFAYDGMRAQSRRASDVPYLHQHLNRSIPSTLRSNTWQSQVSNQHDVPHPSVTFSAFSDTSVTADYQQPETYHQQCSTTPNFTFDDSDLYLPMTSC